LDLNRPWGLGKSCASCPQEDEYLVLVIVGVGRKMKKEIDKAKEIRKNSRRRNTSGMLSMDAIGVKKLPS
jgi:hypothetical protein